jgi:hypothetical protein
MTTGFFSEFGHIRLWNKKAARAEPGRQWPAEAGKETNEKAPAVQARAFLFLDATSRGEFCTLSAATATPRAQ